MKVLITARLTEAQMQSLQEVSPDLQLVRELDPERARQHLGDAEILFTFQLPGPLEEAGALKWIQLISAGAEHLLTAGIERSPVLVTTASGIHVFAMAEYALCAMVMLARRIPLILQESARHQWKPGRLRTYYGEELHGKALGILGFGTIGRGVASTARCLGMRVLGMRRTSGDGALEEAADQMFGPDQLLELLPLCDFVVVTLPLTAETRGLIGKREFRAMRPSAFFINMARGGIVDESALAQALREGGIAGAALDVLAEEPLPQDSEMWDLPNLIVTPHMAGNTLPYLDRAAEIFRENLRHYLAGEPMVNVMDKARGY